MNVDETEKWVAQTLSARADKRWEPQLCAHPSVAGSHAEIAGYPVVADASCAPGQLVIRCAVDVIDRGKTVWTAGEVMATLSGLTLPACNKAIN